MVLSVKVSHTTTVRESFRNDVVAMLKEIQKTSGISDYLVICDTTNNTVESIDRHELYMKVGIRPIKAIEYIIIDLDIINGNVGMNESNAVIKSERGIDRFNSI